MQDGSVLDLDARGYLVNHHQRQLPSPQLSPEQAQQMLSPLLTVDSVRPALIPHLRQKTKRRCANFSAPPSTGDRVLCYINTATGAEEQLLLLVQTPQRHPDQINKTPSACQTEGVLFFEENSLSARDFGRIMLIVEDVLDKKSGSAFAGMKVFSHKVQIPFPVNFLFLLYTCVFPLSMRLIFPVSGHFFCFLCLKCRKYLQIFHFLAKSPFFIAFLPILWYNVVS